MTTQELITVPKSELPEALTCPDSDLAEIQEAIALAAENGGLSEFDIPRITIAPGAFKVQTASGSALVDRLVGVVVYMRNVRTYYKSKVAGHRPPDCYSKDCQTGIGDPGGSCKDCVYAKFGSAVNADNKPGEGQACKETRQLFMLTGTPRMPQIVSIPPTSLQVVRKFFAFLNWQRPFIKTLISIKVQNKSSQGQEFGTAVFDILRPLTDDEVKRSLMFRGAVETYLKATANEPPETEPQQDGQ
jgi:hypothetical protein